MSDQTTFAVDVASAMAIGARGRQEDALAIAFSDGVDPGFAVVSDGMGGHAAGDLASRCIVSEFFSELTLKMPTDGEATAQFPALLRQAVDRANARLGKFVEAGPSRRGMGGTVVATIVAEDRLNWISVGDSVLYLFRDQTLSRLNADHSMAPQIDLMAARGMITEEAARAHPERNCLTSALIGAEIAHIDCPDESFALQDRDLIILASDGLQFLPDEIIEALLIRAGDDGSRGIAQALLKAIADLDDPGQDNTSVVVLRVQATRDRVRLNPFRNTSTAVMKAWRRATSPIVHARSRGS